MDARCSSNWIRLYAANYSEDEMALALFYSWTNLISRFIIKLLRPESRLKTLKWPSFCLEPPSGLVAAGAPLICFLCDLHVLITILVTSYICEPLRVSICVSMLATHLSLLYSSSRLYDLSGSHSFSVTFVICLIYINVLI